MNQRYISTLNKYKSMTDSELNTAYDKLESEFMDAVTIWENLPPGIDEGIGSKGWLAGEKITYEMRVICDIINERRGLPKRAFHTTEKNYKCDGE